MNYVTVLNDKKQIMSYRPKAVYEAPALYAYCFRGAEWAPVINKNNMVTELKLGKEKVAVKPHVAAGEEIIIGDDETASPLYKMELGALPEGAILTNKPYVRGLDGYLYLAGDEPTEKPVSMRIEEIKRELDRIDNEYRTPRTLADATLGSEWARAKLSLGEELAAPLRTELAGLLS